MGSSQQFSLRWNNYLRHITSAFDSLRSDLDLVDVTLSCEGKKIKAHKMLLSACSTYFKDLFKENPCQHPVIIFRNVKFADLEALIDFIYQGEVNVVQEQLASFLTTAELLAVQGLTDGAGQDLAENLNEENVEANVDTIPEEVLPVENKRSSSNTNSHLFTTPNQNPPSPPAKRKKWSAPATQNSSLKRTETNESRRLQPSTSNNSVNLVPEMSQVKVEMPEFLDVESGQISYNNAEQDENPLEALDGIEHSIASASGGKEESMDVFGGGSNDEGDLTGDHLTPAELSQVLSKAGPSSEGSQDSLQGPRGAPPGPGPGLRWRAGRGLRGRSTRWPRPAVRLSSLSSLREDTAPAQGAHAAHAPVHNLTKADGHGKTCLQCRRKGRVTQRGSYVQTRFMCLECGVTLCRKNCFYEFHRERGLPAMPFPYLSVAPL